MGEHDLLPGEEIICRSPEGVILTNDGSICLHNRHHYPGLSRLHRLFNVNDVQSIELLPAKNSIPGKVKLSLRTIYAFLLLIATAMFIVAPFSYGSEVFLNGIDTSLCQVSEDGFHSCEQKSWIKDSPLWLELPAIALGAILIQYGGGFPFGYRIEIAHSNGKMVVKQESVQELERILVLSFISSLLLMPFHGDGLLQGDNLSYLAAIIAIAIAFYLWNAMKKGVSIDNEEKNPSRIEEFPRESMVKFYEQLRSAMGFKGIPDGAEEVRQLGRDDSDGIEEIRKRLDEHDDLLSQISADYDDIFKAVTPWFGVVAVRKSSEKLLSHRIHRILPNPSKEVKVLAQFRDQLKKWDDSFDNEMIMKVDVIISLGNDAAHGSTTTRTDYIAAVERFCELVSWHMDNPAIPITNRNG